MLFFVAVNLTTYKCVRCLSFKTLKTHVYKHKRTPPSTDSKLKINMGILNIVEFIFFLHHNTGTGLYFTTCSSNKVLLVRDILYFRMPFKCSKSLTK
jgi:hypothetical protein